MKKSLKTDYSENTIVGTTPICSKCVMNKNCFVAHWPLGMEKWKTIPELNEGQIQSSTWSFPKKETK